MFRIRGDSKFLLVCAANAVQPAQALDAIQPSLLALREQLASNLLGAVALALGHPVGHPVDATATLMRRFDGNDQPHIVEFARGRDFACTPSLVATLGHVHQRTQPSNGVLMSKFINHGVPQRLA